MKERLTFIDGYKPLPRFERTCCINCRYFDGISKGTCSAYPKGIPDKFAVRNMYGLMEYHCIVEKDQIGSFTYFT